MKSIIAAIISMLLALLMGSTSAYCDSCGEPWKSSAMTTCTACGATICPVCRDSYTCDDGRCFC